MCFGSGSAGSWKNKNYWAGIGFITDPLCIYSYLWIWTWQNSKSKFWFYDLNICIGPKTCFHVREEHVERKCSFSETLWQVAWTKKCISFETSKMKGHDKNIKLIAAHMNANRSRQALSSSRKIGVDTAENELLQFWVCYISILIWFRYPTSTGLMCTTHPAGGQVHLQIHANIFWVRILLRQQVW